MDGLDGYDAVAEGGELYRRGESKIRMGHPSIRSAHQPFTKRGAGRYCPSSFTSVGEGASRPVRCSHRRIPRA